MKKILAITLVVLFSMVSTGFTAGDKVQGEDAHLGDDAKIQGSPPETTAGERLRAGHPWEGNDTILLDLLEIFLP